MKGQVKVRGRSDLEYLNDTPSSSSYLGSDYQKYEDNSPSSYTISQELVGKNDNIYRLFIVSLS